MVLAGEKIHASDIPARVAALLRQTVAQAVPTGTFTDITLDAEDNDDEAGHSLVTNTARYTAVAGGLYLVCGIGALVADASSVRAVRLAVNGSAVAASQVTAQGSGSFAACLSVSRLVPLAAADYVTLQILHNKGSNLNTSVSAEAASQLSVMLVNA